MFCFLCFKLIYLKVTALLFPTSDFRHPVATPALLYISQALTKVHTDFIVFSSRQIQCLHGSYVEVNLLNATMSVSLDK